METGEDIAVSTSPKRDTGNKLDKIIRANAEKVEKAAREGAEPIKRKRSQRKAADGEPRKPAEEEAATAEDSEGQGDAQAKASDGKTKEPKAEPKPAKAADEPKEPGKQVKAEPKPEEGADNPFAPKTWTEDERSAFAKAPAEVQQAVNKLVKNLQGGFTKRMMQLADVQRVAEDVAAAFQPHHRQEMQSANLSEGQVLKQFLGLHDQWKANPVGYIRQLMNTARISPEQLLGAPQQGGAAPNQPQGDGQGQPHADPVVAALQTELATLKGVLTQAATQSRGRQEAEKQAKLNDAQKAILAFEHSTDESGAQTYPHFQKVWQHMMALCVTDPAIAAIPDYGQRLGAAYERATWADPEIRKALQDAEKTRIESDLERTRSKAAVTVKPRQGVGTASGTVVKKGKRSLDDILAEKRQQFGV